MFQSQSNNPLPSSSLPPELKELPNLINRFETGSQVADFLLTDWQYRDQLTVLIPNKAFFFKGYLLVNPPAGQAQMNRLNINTASQFKLSIVPDLKLPQETKGLELLVFDVGTEDPAKFPCISNIKNISEEAKGKLIEDLKTIFSYCNSVNDALTSDLEMVRYNESQRRIIILDWGSCVRARWINENIDAFEQHLKKTLATIVPN